MGIIEEVGIGVTIGITGTIGKVANIITETINRGKRRNQPPKRMLKPLASSSTQMVLQDSKTARSRTLNSQTIVICER